MNINFSFFKYNKICFIINKDGLKHAEQFPVH